MNRQTRTLSALLFICLSTPVLHAGGFLWIGAEFAEEGHLYRYDIASGQIDVDCTIPLSGNSHWNNVTVDDSFVYIGSPLTDYLGVVESTPLSPTSCNLTGSTTYSSPLSGHKEDGAYHPTTGRQWRVTYTGSQLYETAADGTVVSAYTISGIAAGLVGLAWVDDRLYATDYDGTRLGELVFGQTSVTWNSLTWTGTAPPASLAALAFDREDDLLYMIAASRHLYAVTIDNLAGTAEASLVAELETVGYPVGALADGMGWIAGVCTDTPVQIMLQPAAEAAPVGAPLSLEVAAGGTTPVTYQWRRGGIPLVDGGTVLGSTTPTLTIDPAAANDAGLYDCVVTNVCGSAVSDTALVTIGSAANGSGYLWLGAEYAGEGSYYRYDLVGNVIDRVCPRTLPPGGEHWNNMATDGQHLYIGAPNHQLLGRVSGYNCDTVSDFTYSPVLDGRLEDGAYNNGTSTLWRVSYSGSLYETSSNGALLQTYNVPGGLVGLAWTDVNLYATSHDAGSIGEITLGAAPIATYTEIPWDGSAPQGTMGALAYDLVNDVLYLVTRSSLLYSVTFNAGMATATLIEDLGDVGYPEGALPDGMGWIGTCLSGADLTITIDADETLRWNPAPDATYDVVSGAFSTDLSSNTWAGAGGILGTLDCRANDSGLTHFGITGLDDPTPGSVSIWLVRACAGTWNSGGVEDRDVDILCP